VATNREEDILEAMQRLKIESQRLIRQHRDLLETFDLLKQELDQIRRERRQNSNSVLPQIWLQK
jgi:hypothetical protein